jgi:hypothetical protein
MRDGEGIHAAAFGRGDGDRRDLRVRGRREAEHGQRDVEERTDVHDDLEPGNERTVGLQERGVEDAAGA